MNRGNSMQVVRNKVLFPLSLGQEASGSTRVRVGGSPRWKRQGTVGLGVKRKEEVVWKERPRGGGYHADGEAGRRREREKRRDGKKQ